MIYKIYDYERRKIPGGFDSNNVNRVNESGNQIFIAKEIESVIPGKRFLVRCDLCCIKILFDEEDDLTDAEKVTLDMVVSTHRANG